MANPGQPLTEGLLSLRAAVILLLGALAGGAVAGVTVAAGRSPAEAVLAGLFALAGGIRFFHWLINSSGS